VFFFFFFLILNPNYAVLIPLRFCASLGSFGFKKFVILRYPLC
jgi:hypothetical protein